MLKKGVLMKSVMLAVAVLSLTGCKDRVIWDDNGKLETATEGREIWNTNGQMESGERKIWVNAEGKEIIK